MENSKSGFKQEMPDTGNIRHKIIVLSGKGGVGKSTVAGNLALALSLKGFSTGLLDIDIHGPSVPKLFGLEETRLSTEDNKIIPVSYSDNLKIISIGFLLQSNEDAVIWKGPLKHTVIRQFLSDVAWGDLDYLIIDSPPGTGDEPLSIAQLIEGDKHSVIVSTPQDLAISDVTKSVTFCNKLEIKILGIIENMNGFICPHCRNISYIFKKDGVKKFAASKGLNYLGSIPLDPDIVMSSDNGTPLAGGPADEGITAVLLEIASEIQGLLS